MHAPREKTGVGEGWFGESRGELPSEGGETPLRQLPSCRETETRRHSLCVSFIPNKVCFLCKVHVRGLQAARSAGVSPDVRALRPGQGPLHGAFCGRAPAGFWRWAGPRLISGAVGTARGTALRVLRALSRLSLDRPVTLQMGLLLTLTPVPPPGSVFFGGFFQGSPLSCGPAPSPLYGGEKDSPSLGVCGGHSANIPGAAGRRWETHVQAHMTGPEA